MKKFRMDNTEGFTEKEIEAMNKSFQKLDRRFRNIPHTDEEIKKEVLRNANYLKNDKLNYTEKWFCNWI